MATQKHLTLNDRIHIQQMLSSPTTFSAIASSLDKDPSTISKEIRNHLVFTRVGYGHVNYNACANRFSCTKTNICNKCTADKKYKKCSNCYACNKNCSDFVQVICQKLLKPPYVCNCCSKRYSGCTLEKRYYKAKTAQDEYQNVLSECRSGSSLTEDELKLIDDIVSPLIRQHQSPHHIWVHNRDTIMISESTIYRLIDAHAISALNIDLPRKVRFRVRRKKLVFKVDKKCRIGRSYPDFLDYMKEHPDTPVTELDSVEGKKGGKVLLTIHFVKAELMLAFIRDHNDSRSVTKIFNDLYEILKLPSFSKIFRLCLADNGSEFSDPKSIELSPDGDIRTRVFYCDPNAPQQKGSAERNHEFIRMFIPKGKDLAPYTQDDINLMMDHINSYSRESIGDKCPYEMFAFLYGEEILKLLGCHRILPQNVTLSSSIFRKEVRS